MKKALPWTLLAVSLVLLIAITLALPKTISWDPGYGLLAAQHFSHGRSSNIESIIVADPDNIAKDIPNRITWWAPSYQFLPWLFHGREISWGAAIGIVTVLCLLLGLGGWGWLYHKILGSAVATGWMLLILSCSRYQLLFTINYAGGDMVLWAITPWIVLINLVSLKSQESSLLILLLTLATGGVTCGVFIIKYSGLTLCLGFGVCWILTILRNSKKWKNALSWCAGGALMAIVILYSGFPGGSTPGTPTAWAWLRVSRAFVSLGLFSIGTTDLDSFFGKVFALTGMDNFQHVRSILGLFLAAPILFFIINSWRKLWQRDACAHIPDMILSVMTVALFDVLFLAIAILMSDGVGMDARLARCSGLLLLPVAAREIGLSTSRRIQYVLATVYLIGPAIYGLTAGTIQIADRFQCRNAARSTEEVLCPWLSPSKNDLFFTELESKLPDHSTLLYVTYPQLAFPLSNRRIILGDPIEMATFETLKKMHYQGHLPGGVALLLPLNGEFTAKCEIIKSSFAGVAKWERKIMVADSRWCLWLGR